MKPDAGSPERQRIMSALAQGRVQTLEHAWNALPERPCWRFVRRPETGLVMIRGRAGGEGAPFNLGEATVTRCAIALESGEIGYAIVLGRNEEQARLAACFDALWQREEGRALVEGGAVAAIVAEQRADDEKVRAETAATKVDFFTLVRGED